MKIICFGQNYKEHVQEMHEVEPSEPFFFLKPDSALLLKNQAFYYPDFSKDIEYEAELVVRINRLGKNIQERFAHKYYHEIALGIDFTARDIQQKAKEKGLPWSIAKSFDNSAAMSHFVALEDTEKDINRLSFNLTKNGKIVQQANTSDMIWNVDTLIAFASRFMTLKVGDLIFTGTPAGAGSVEIGDTLEAFLEGNSMISCTIK